MAARIERQTILSRENPVLFRAHIDEAVLYRMVGSPQIMHDQLAALIEAARRENISVQVVPMDTGQTAGLSGGFVIASIEGKPDTVYLDSATEGRVTDHPREVAETLNRYDAIRTEALPVQASLDLITKVMDEKWAQTSAAPNGAKPSAAPPTAATASRSPS